MSESVSAGPLGYGTQNAIGPLVYGIRTVSAAGA